MNKLTKAQVKRIIKANGRVTLQIVPHKLQPTTEPKTTFTSVEELEDTIAVLTIDPAIYNYQDGYYPAFYEVPSDETVIPESEPTIEVGTKLVCHTTELSVFGHDLVKGEIYTVVEIQRSTSEAYYIRLEDSSGLPKGSYVLRNSTLGLSYKRWFKVDTSEPELLEYHHGDKVRVDLTKQHGLYTVKRSVLLQTLSDEWWDEGVSVTFSDLYNARAIYHQTVDDILSERNT